LRMLLPRAVPTGLSLALWWRDVGVEEEEDESAG